ncbi:MAG: hypothetical protein IPI66_13150 [Chitinophagaceae bacterium]|nr:hypothetical protein [Chitinophagaceae bacterium]
MRKIAIFAGLFSLFCACHENKEEPDGGPCKYDRKNLRATLVRLHEVNEKEYDALFLLERGRDQKDSILYSAMNNHHYIQSAVLPADSLVIGKDYQYLQQTIRSGACSPNADQLFLKPYAE